MRSKKPLLVFCRYGISHVWGDLHLQRAGNCRNAQSYQLLNKTIYPQITQINADKNVFRKHPVCRYLHPQRAASRRNAQ